MHVCGGCACRYAAVWVSALGYLEHTLNPGAVAPDATAATGAESH